MSSWRSRFRRTKTPEAGETKTTSIFSKNSEDSDHQRNRISRFLRRSKHDDDTSDRPRPRSVYLERTTTDFNGEQKTNLSPRNLGDPPSVQEILDRNRRERAAAKSPRPWRKFLTGDRSPNTNKRGDSGSVGHEEYSYKSRYRDENRNYDNEKYETSSQVSNDSQRSSRRGRQFEEDAGRKNGMEDARNGRKTSQDGSLKSESDKSAGKLNKERSRSVSPYDNVEETSKKRRERRARSMYVDSRNEDTAKDSETTSIADKPVSPLSKRRERMRRSESQDTVNSERSARSQTRIEKETYLSRRPKAYYNADDDSKRRKPRSQNEDDKDSFRSERSHRGQNEDLGENESRNQNERDVFRKSPRGYRKLSDGRASGYTTDNSVRDNDKVNRFYERGNYSRRSSENILGAALNYIERKPTHDYLSTATSKMIEEYNESPRERRRRFRGQWTDKSLDNISVPDSDMETNKTSRRKYSYASSTSSYKPSVETTSYRSSAGRRDSYAKARPKSLYDYHEPLSFSDSYSKFKEEENASYGDRYRPRYDYGAKDEPERYRPKTLFMVDDEKKDSAYRGNWSATVPKKPSHLKDFSKPDETSTGYSWRRGWRERQEEADTASASKDVDKDSSVKTRKKSDSVTSSRAGDTSRGVKGMETTLPISGRKWSDTDRDRDKEAGNSAENKEERGRKENRMSYIRRQSRQEIKSPEDQQKLKIPAFEFTVSQPKEEPAEEKFVAKEQSKMETLGDDTVVRRRRKEHVPPARPSSIYFVKREESLDDTMPAKKEEKSKASLEDNDDDDDGSRRRSRRRPNVNLDSEDIKAGLRKKSAVERRLRSKYTRERPKSVNLADVFALSDAAKGRTSNLPKVPVRDPLRDTVDEVKREFEKLLRRTEDWKLRTDTLNTRATVLSTSYKSLNKAITGIRDESDDMYAVIDNIGERLNVNDSIGYPDTEEEWKRAFEAGKLLEKALRMIDYQKRHPKPDFEYSDSESDPPTPGKPFYDMPDGIPWFSRHTSRGSRLSSLMDQYSTRKVDDYIESSSKSYVSYRPSLDVMNSIAMSSSARYSPSYVSDIYTRRSRYADNLLDYKASSNALNASSSNGRIIPETAV